MKRLIAILLPIWFCSPAWTAPNYTGNFSSGTFLSGNPQNTIPCNSINLTSGNIISCFGTFNDNNALSSVSNTGVSITWNVVSGMQSDDPVNGQNAVGAWGSVNATGSASPTLHATSQSNFLGCMCAEFSGTNSTVDGSSATVNVSAGTGTNAQNSGVITTTVNGDLLVGGIIDDTGSSAFTAGTVSASFTKIACNNDFGVLFCMEWGTQTTAGANTKAAWTSSIGTDNTIANIISFQSAAVAAVAPTNQVIIQGGQMKITGGQVTIK